MLKFANFKNMYKGYSSYVVGKGKSLEFLSNKYFIDNQSPVICLNESIVTIEQLGITNPIFSLQKDGYADHMVRPSDNSILILQNTIGYSRDYYPDHPKRLLLDPVKDLNFKLDQTVSIRMAIAFLKYMGCNHISFLCCDILSNKDSIETFDPRMNTSSVTVAAKFYKSSRVYVLTDIKNINHDFITPTL